VVEYESFEVRPQLTVPESRPCRPAAGPACGAFAWPTGANALVVACGCCTLCCCTHWRSLALRRLLNQETCRFSAALGSACRRLPRYLQLLGGCWRPWGRGVTDCARSCCVGDIASGSSVFSRSPAAGESKALHERGGCFRYLVVAPVPAWCWYCNGAGMKPAPESLTFP